MQTAGPKSGINAYDKAARAVDSVKVLLALNSISGVLKVGASPLPFPQACAPSQEKRVLAWLDLVLKPKHRWHVCLQKRQEGAGGEEMDTLKSLTSFLTLSKAEDAGFDATKYGLSQDEAGSIATIFSRYDSNDDMILDQSEVNRLLCAPTHLQPAHPASDGVLTSVWGAACQKAMTWNRQRSGKPSRCTTTRCTTMLTGASTAD